MEIQANDDETLADGEEGLLDCCSELLLGRARRSQQGAEHRYELLSREAWACGLVECLAQRQAANDCRWRLVHCRHLQASPCNELSGCPYGMHCKRPGMQ